MAWKAVFGQVTYTVLPGLKATAGARYEEATEDLSFVTDGYFGGGTPPFSSAARGHALTPKGVLAYDVTPPTMVYASAAEGFRDGGVNRPVPVPLCSADLAGLGLTQAPTEYKSDKLWSYEVGVKSRVLQNSLVMLALSLFITNLLNEDKAIQRPSVAGVEYGIRVRPRTFGIGGTYNF